MSCFWDLENQKVFLKESNDMGKTMSSNGATT